MRTLGSFKVTRLSDQYLYDSPCAVLLLNTLIINIIRQTSVQQVSGSANVNVLIMQDQFRTLPRKCTIY